MSPLCKVRPLVALALVALSGCTAAHIVSRDANGGVVAIPKNSNTWPFYYRDNAEALIKKECGPDYLIVREEGGTTACDSTAMRNQNMSPPDAPFDGSTPSTTDRLRDRTEYRIFYRRKNLTPASGAANMAGGPPPPGTPCQQVSPLQVPAPTPVPQRGYP